MHQGSKNPAAGVISGKNRGSAERKEWRAALRCILRSGCGGLRLLGCGYAVLRLLAENFSGEGKIGLGARRVAVIVHDWLPVARRLGKLDVSRNDDVLASLSLLF